jgi:type VI secretion system protein ImpG
MDAHMLRLYNDELRFLREMGGEFAAAFPKVAGRLGLDAAEVTDPYVERLLEGCAFLTARVQLKLESQFPAFTQHLLEMVYPHYLAPTPSMAVVQLTPDPEGGRLEKGYAIPAGTSLIGRMARDGITACEFRTAHPVHLWPIAITDADYFATSGQISALQLAERSNAELLPAAGRWHRRCAAGPVAGGLRRPSAAAARLASAVAGKIAGAIHSPCRLHRRRSNPALRSAFLRRLSPAAGVLCATRAGAVRGVHWPR